MAADIDDYRDRRESMLAILKSLTLTGDRAQLLRSSEALAASKDRTDYEQSLDVLETLIRDAWMLSLEVKPGQLVNEDLLPELEKISKQLDAERAAQWILQIEDMREQLVVNINRKVATDVFLATA
jgi:hypothetical protein